MENIITALTEYNTPIYGGKGMLESLISCQNAMRASSITLTQIEENKVKSFLVNRANVNQFNIATNEEEVRIVDGVYTSRKECTTSSITVNLKESFLSLPNINGILDDVITNSLNQLFNHIDTQLISLYETTRGNSRKGNKTPIPVNLTTFKRELELEYEYTSDNINPIILVGGKSFKDYYTDTPNYLGYYSKNMNILNLGVDRGDDWFSFLSSSLQLLEWDSTEESGHIQTNVTKVIMQLEVGERVNFLVDVYISRDECTKSYTLNFVKHYALLEPVRDRYEEMGMLRLRPNTKA